MRDQFARPLGTLRISLTDRCNLRCRYCMPDSDYSWLPRDSILRFEEIVRLARAFVESGISTIRLTGGEPLLRRDVAVLVRMIRAACPAVDLAMTTNGTLLASHARELREAGLDRITISLDSLRQERVTALQRNARVVDVIAGIDAARAAGFVRTRINTVVLRGVNDDELVELVQFAAGRGIEPRFIEYMDVGGATAWRPDLVVSANEILAGLAPTLGPPTPLSRAADPHATARRYLYPDGTVVGIIASTTAPFCGDCDRARITADGRLLLCLYTDSGLDLRDPLRNGAGDAELVALIAGAWRARIDRGAEARHAQLDRRPLVSIAGLREQPWREMHVRGG